MFLNLLLHELDLLLLQLFREQLCPEHLDLRRNTREGKQEAAQCYLRHV
jgi:hypothetical protein